MSWGGVGCHWSQGAALSRTRGRGVPPYPRPSGYKERAVANEDEAQGGSQLVKGNPCAAPEF